MRDTRSLCAAYARQGLRLRAQACLLPGKAQHRKVLAVSTRTEYIYIWVLLGAGGVARPLVRDHALLFLPRARSSGTGAQTTHTMMQMYLKSVARSLSVFSASSGARYEPNPVMSAAS